MKFLSGILPPPKKRKQETAGKTTVHRRVEVTVDREMVSIVIPAHPQQAPAEARHQSELMEQLAELPPASRSRIGELTRPSTEEGQNPTRNLKEDI